MSVQLVPTPLSTSLRLLRSSQPCGVGSPQSPTLRRSQWRFRGVKSHAHGHPANLTPESWSFQ